MAQLPFVSEFLDFVLISSCFRPFLLLAWLVFEFLLFELVSSSLHYWSFLMEFLLNLTLK